MAKFCPNCGRELEDDQKFCPGCGTNQNPDETINQNANVTNETVNISNPDAKSRLVAGLLGIFLGCFGVHNFYLGYNGKAIAQLLITVLSCFVLSGISFIWGLIEAILILVGTINTDANGVKLID